VSIFQKMKVAFATSISKVRFRRVKRYSFLRRRWG